MQTIAIGLSSLFTSRLAYGCWRLAGTWDPARVTPEAEAHGRRAVIAAYEAGYTLFDNADIYCRGVAESILGAALKQVSGMRNRVVIATKCGVRFAGDPKPAAPGRYDFSASHIIRSCEGSLKRLGVETIDLYQLHRPDYLGNPDEVAGAFAQLRDSGKVRYFGVSNFRPSLLTAFQSALPVPLVVNQVEISLARLDTFDDGTLDQCLAQKITPLAWSPLAQGTLGDASSFPGAKKPSPAAKRIIPVLKRVAQAHKATPANVALAWLLKHPSRIVPIVGSVNPDRIREAVKALDIELSREEWYDLFIAARGEPMP